MNCELFLVEWKAFVDTVGIKVCWVEKWIFVLDFYGFPYDHDVGRGRRPSWEIEIFRRRRLCSDDSDLSIKSEEICQLFPEEWSFKRDKKQRELSSKKRT